MLKAEVSVMVEDGDEVRKRPQPVPVEVQKRQV